MREADELIIVLRVGAQTADADGHAVLKIAVEPGLGAVLLRGAVRLALERGQYAFGQVFIDNAPSLALQQKVGMSVSDEILYWLF